ncbi:MAG: hypothetical protein AAF518_15240 [Spirochaetota bacterium]
MNKFFILGCILFLSHCYSTERRYTTGSPVPEKTVETFDESNPQFESGEPYKIIDYPAHYIFSLPSKLVFLSWEVDNHQISDKTKQYLKKYIQENNLKNVKVRFNQYAPIDDLQRLWKNENINVLLKYTAGIVGWFIKSVVPERLFSGLLGGDHYDQFTNTIHIYSDSIPIAIHEGGHAKDFSLRTQKSWYTLLRVIPVIGALYQEGRATDDAIGYISYKCDRKQERKAYTQLSPAYSTYIFSDFLGSFSILASIPGHIWGYFTAKSFDEKQIPRCEGKQDFVKK